MQILRKHLRCRRIVCDIENPQWIAGAYLEAAWQTHRLQAGTDMSLSNREPCCKSRQCGKRGTGVGELGSARQGRIRQFFVVQRRAPPRPIGRGALVPEVSSKFPQRHLLDLGDGRNAGRHVRVAENRRTAATKYAGLLACDGFDIRAQPIAVIQRHRCDDRDIGVDHVGGIEAPAHAHFQHHDIGFCIPENQQGRKCIELEECQTLCAASLLDLFERAA